MHAKGRSNKNIIDQINVLIFDILGKLKKQRASKAVTYVDGKFNTENKNTWHSRDPDRKYSALCLNQELISKIKVKKSFELIAYISMELKMNNPLWYACRRKSQMRTAIADLKQCGILYELRLKGIYYVNPNFICKGDPLVVIKSLAYYLERKKMKYPDVTVTDIVDLKSPPSGYMNLHYTLWQMENI